MVGATLSVRWLSSRGTATGRDFDLVQGFGLFLCLTGQASDPLDVSVPHLRDTAESKRAATASVVANPSSELWVIENRECIVEKR